MDDDVSPPKDEVHPEPLETLVAAIKIGPAWVTGIVRTWPPGEPIRCYRCPRDLCEVSTNGTCLVLTTDPVERGEAHRYTMPGALAAGGGSCSTHCKLPTVLDQP